MTYPYQMRASNEKVTGRREAQRNTGQVNCPVSHSSSCHNLQHIDGSMSPPISWPVNGKADLVDFVRFCSSTDNALSDTICLPLLIRPDDRRLAYLEYLCHLGCESTPR